MAHFFPNTKMQNIHTKTRLVCITCYYMTNQVNNSPVFRFSSEFSASKVIIFPSADNKDCFKCAYVTTTAYIGSAKTVSNPGVIISMN